MRVFKLLFATAIMTALVVPLAGGSASADPQPATALACYASNDPGPDVFQETVVAVAVDFPEWAAPMVCALGAPPGMSGTVLFFSSHDGGFSVTAGSTAFFPSGVSYNGSWLGAEFLTHNSPEDGHIMSFQMVCPPWAPDDVTCSADTWSS